MHRSPMRIIIALCLSVLLTTTIVGCSSSDNSDGNFNDRGDMMDDGNSSDGDMINDDGSGGDQGNRPMNP